MTEGTKETEQWY